MHTHPSGQDDKEYYSQVLTTVDRRVSDWVIESHETAENALQNLKDFTSDLQSTTNRWEEQCRNIYVDHLVGLRSPSLADDYIETQFLREDSCVTVAEELVESPASFEARDTATSPFPLFEDYRSDNLFPTASVNPRLISNQRSVSPETSTITSPSSPLIAVSALAKRARPLRNPIVGRRSRLSDLADTIKTSAPYPTRYSQRKRGQLGKGRTKAGPPPKLRSKVHPVVHGLIEGVSSTSSLIQLKEALHTFRGRLIASIMSIPGSTDKTWKIKEIWEHLNLLEYNTHINHIIYRLRLVQLNSRRKVLSASMKGGGPQVMASVIDKIAQEVEEEDREKVKSRLHEGTVWAAISDEFSTGILALIPTKRGHWPSNTAIGKLCIKDLNGFLKSTENDHYKFIKQAAQKVTEIMPLFEGKACETFLKMEHMGIEELNGIEDKSILLNFLDSI